MYMKQIHSLLSDSPFRMLGIWSNGYAGEAVSGVARFKALLNAQQKLYSSQDLPDLLNNTEKVAKNVLQAQAALHLPEADTKGQQKLYCQQDLPVFLGGIVRTEENIKQAQAVLKVPEARLTEVLFWFVEQSAADTEALSCLALARKDDDSYIRQARNIWAQKNSPASLLNRAVLAMMLDDMGQAVQLYIRFLNHEDTCTVFLPDLVPGVDKFLLTKSSLLYMLLDRLLTVCEARELEQIVSFFDGHTTYFAAKKAEQTHKLLAQMDRICSQYKYDLCEPEQDTASFKGLQLAYRVSDCVKQFSALAKTLLQTDPDMLHDSRYLSFVEQTFNFLKFYVERFIAASSVLQDVSLKIFVGLIDELQQSCNAVWQQKFQTLLSDLMYMQKFKQVRAFMQQYQPDPDSKTDGSAPLFILQQTQDSILQVYKTAPTLYPQIFEESAVKALGMLNIALLQIVALPQDKRTSFGLHKLKQLADNAELFIQRFKVVYKPDALTEDSRTFIKQTMDVAAKNISTLRFSAEDSSDNLLVDIILFIFLMMGGLVILAVVLVP